MQLLSLSIPVSTLRLLSSAIKTIGVDTVNGFVKVPPCQLVLENIFSFVLFFDLLTEIVRLANSLFYNSSSCGDVSNPSDAE